MCFLNDRDKMRVLTAAKLMGNVQYTGKTVYFAQDLPEGIREQRAQFPHLCEEFRKEG